MTINYNSAEDIRELSQLFLELYPQQEMQLTDFLDMLGQFRSERDPALQELDRQRAENPDWFRSRQVLGMQMYPQCFGGDLPGVRAHIDYLEELGVNYLHLMPLMQSPPDRSDGGYAVADFRKVQPEFGTIDDLRLLTRECHEKGISVCLDFVMNHTSEDHEWARRARAGEKEYQDMYYFYHDRTIPDEYEKLVPQVFPTTAPGNFSWCEELQKYVMTTFYPFQWDLNYANPRVLKEMTANMLFLTNCGVDVIRLDATPYIWKELGTNCRNLPQVHTLVRMLNLVCKIVCPGTVLLGEVVMEPSKVVPYFGTPEAPECQMLYNVTTMATTWHTVATRDVRLMRHQLEQVFALPGSFTFLNYLRCHDDIGWGLDYPWLRQFGIDEVAHKKFLSDWFTGRFPGSPAKGELYNDDPTLGDARQCGTTASLCGMDTDPAAGLKLDTMLHAFLLFQSGIPIIYSGDEIAQRNDETYHQDPDKQADSRYLHRGALDWTKAASRKNTATPEGQLYSGIRQLLTARRNNPAFDASADVWLMEPQNNSILAIGRYGSGQGVIGLFNFSDAKETARLNEAGTFRDLITGEILGAESVEMEPFAFRWMVEE